MSITTDANQLRMSVTDTGQGIEKAHIDRLFGPYWTGRKRGAAQASASTSPKASPGRMAVRSG